MNFSRDLVANNVPPSNINPSDSESGDKQVNSIVLTTLCPIQTEGIRIPDFSTVATTTKKTLINQSLQIPSNAQQNTPDILFLYLPHNKRYAIYIFVKWPQESIFNYTFWKVVDADQKVADVYSRSRFVSGAFSVVANTVTGTDLTIRGDINAVQFQDLPEISTLNHATITSYKRNDKDVISSRKISDGVIAIAHPDDDTTLKPTLTHSVYNSDSAILVKQIVQFSGGLSQEFELPIIGIGALELSVQTIIQCLFVDNVNNDNKVEINLELMGDEFDDATNTVSEVLLDRACIGCTETMALGEEACVCPTGGFTWVPTTVLSIYTGSAIPAKRIKVRVNGFIGSTSWTEGEFVVMVKYLENYWTGYSRPGTLISVSGVAPNTQLELGGATNWEVVPDKTLQKDIPITTSSKGDPSDLLVLKYLMAAGFPDPRIKFLYTLKEYDALWSAGLFNEVARRHNLDKYAMSLPGILKQGWHMFRPLIRAGVPALASMINPSLAAPAAFLARAMTEKTAAGSYSQPRATYVPSAQEFHDPGLEGYTSAGTFEPEQMKKKTRRYNAYYSSGTFQKSQEEVKKTIELRPKQTTKRKIGRVYTPPNPNNVFEKMKPVVMDFRKRASGQLGAQAPKRRMLLRANYSLQQNINEKGPESITPSDGTAIVSIVSKSGEKIDLQLPSIYEKHKVKFMDYYVGSIDNIAEDFACFSKLANKWNKCVIAPLFVRDFTYSNVGRTTAGLINSIKEFLKDSWNDVRKMYRARANKMSVLECLKPYKLPGFEKVFQRYLQLKKKGDIAVTKHRGTWFGPRMISDVLSLFNDIRGVTVVGSSFFVEDSDLEFEFCLLLRYLKFMPLNEPFLLSDVAIDHVKASEDSDSETEYSCAGSFTVATTVIGYDDPVLFDADQYVDISGFALTKIKDPDIAAKLNNWLRGDLRQQSYGISAFPAVSSGVAARTVLIWSMDPVSAGRPLSYTKITAALNDEVFSFYISSSCIGDVTRVDTQEFLTSIAHGLYWASVPDDSFLTIPVKGKFYGTSAGLAAYMAGIGAPRGGLFSAGVSAEGLLLPVTEVEAKKLLSETDQIGLTICTENTAKIAEDTSALFLGDWNEGSKMMLSRQRKKGKGTIVRERADMIAAPVKQPIFHVNKFGPAVAACFAMAVSLPLTSEVRSTDKATYEASLSKLAQVRTMHTTPIQIFGEGKSRGTKIQKFKPTDPDITLEELVDDEKYGQEAKLLLSMPAGDEKNRRMTQLSKSYYGIIVKKGATEGKKLGQALGKLKKQYKAGAFEVYKKFGFKFDPKDLQSLQTMVDTNQRPDTATIQRLMQLRDKLTEFRNKRDIQEDLSRDLSTIYSTTQVVMKPRAAQVRKQVVKLKQPKMKEKEEKQVYEFEEEGEEEEGELSELMAQISGL